MSCQFHRYVARLLSAVFGTQAVPITRLSRAASTTSLVIVSQLVDLQDPLDLAEQPLDQAEVAAGDPDDRRDRLGIGEVVRGRASGRAAASGARG